MKDLTFKVKLYIGLIIIVGLTMLAHSISGLEILVSGSLLDIKLNSLKFTSLIDDIPLSVILFFVLLGVVAESLPIVLKKDHLITVSFAISLSSILLFGTGIATIIRFISSLLAIRRVNGKVFHLLNISLYKVLFNGFSRVVVVYITAQFYILVASIFKDATFGQFNIMGIIGLMLLYLILDTTIYTLLFALIQKVNFFKLVRGKLWMSVNLLGISPIGIIIAYAYLEMSIFAVALFFGPLLIARYSFKLYLDAKDALNDTINVLSNAMDAKDHYTNGHSLRVAEYSDKIGRAMGMPEKCVTKMHSAAILHDIGKIGIEDQILNKTGRLINVEFERIKEHPEIGANILDQVHNLADIAFIVRYHHVHFNGGGYPEVPENVEVPIEAYIISVSDAFDAMTSDRPYRQALGTQEAIKRIREGRDTQFHPDVVDAFMRVMIEERELVVNVS